MTNPTSRRRQIQLSRSRWLSDLARKGKLYNPQKAKSPITSSSLSGYRSKILDMFWLPPERRYKRTPLKPKTFVLPSIFSLSRRTESVLTVAISIAKYARIARAPRITIDHRPVTHLGLAAETLLAIVLKEISLECRVRPRYSLRGLKPENEAARRILKEVGCARILREKDDTLEVSLQPDTKVYRHFNRSYRDTPNTFSINKIGQTVRKFSDHLDSCLSGVKKRLSPAGKDLLLGYVSEVIENADEHSDSAIWVIIGYIDEGDSLPRYRCVILSLGLTIAESFQRLPKDCFAWKQVEPYVKSHQQRKLFSPQWTEESLLTVAALQESVSSKNISAETDRGQGTVELVEFFQT